MADRRPGEAFGIGVIPLFSLGESRIEINVLLDYKLSKELTTGG
jgi:hypothetical protein